jgi:hypothetical protein
MRSAEQMALVRVQRWVVSALIGAVTLFPLGALAVTIHLRVDSDPAGAVILNVMMGAIGAASVAAILLVHKRSPWSPYLALGMLAAAGSVLWTWII